MPDFPDYYDLPSVDLPGMWDRSDFIDTSDGICRDPSDNPPPEDVIAHLNSGIAVKCELRYDGIQSGTDDRRYLIIAEIDWENYHIKTLEVGVLPSDVSLRLRVPGMPDTTLADYIDRMRVVVQKGIHL